MKLSTAILFVFLFALVACAPIQNELKLPPKRSYYRGFSLIPPNEPGWSFINNNYNSLVLSKYGKVPNETYVIMSSIIGLPHLDTPDDFINEVTRVLKDKVDPSRFYIFENSSYVKPYAKTYNCLLSYQKVKDNAALQGNGRTAIMILDQVALICKHPAREDVGVYIGYSYRHYSENSDPDLIEKADKLFQSVYLDDLDQIY